MPFYTGDWFKCPEVRALSLDHRALWFDLICYMWDSTERGVMVKPNGKPYSDQEIIRMVGLDNQNSGNWLQILLDDGVCSRREDGAIYSRRMVKDEAIRMIRKEVGKKGGNPNLVNQKGNQNIESETANVNESKAEFEKRAKKVIEDVKEYISFDKFWDLYDKKVGDKTKLKKKWDALSFRDQCSIIAYIPMYKRSQPDKAFRKNPETFLNNKSWNDELIQRGGVEAEIGVKTGDIRDYQYD